MHIMDHLMSQPILEFLDSFFTLVTKFGANVGLNILINTISGFYRTWKKINAFSNFALEIIISALKSAIFLRSFSNAAQHLLSYDLGRVWLWRFYLIKYAHNGHLNELADFGISGLIIQGKAIKCCINAGLNIIFDISSVFYQECESLPFYCQPPPVYLHQTYYSAWVLGFIILTILSSLLMILIWGLFWSRQQWGLPSSDDNNCSLQCHR